MSEGGVSVLDVPEVDVLVEGPDPLAIIFPERDIINSKQRIKTKVFDKQYNSCSFLDCFFIVLSPLLIDDELK